MNFIKNIIISACILPMITQAMTIDQKEYKRTVDDICSTEYIEKTITTDEFSFLAYQNSILDAFNIDGLKKRSPVEYNLRLFGTFLHYTDNNNEIFFIKTFDLNTKETRWINADIVTGNPSFDKNDIIKEIETNICGLREINIENANTQKDDGVSVQIIEDIDKNGNIIQNVEYIEEDFAEEQTQTKKNVADNLKIIEEQQTKTLKLMDGAIKSVDSLD